MIGIFDSGVGGLTVVKEIFKDLPGYQIIYFGDTARLPYGTKGPDFVKKYSKKIAQWLLNRGAKIIVIACNTASAQAADYLKKEFPNIPIFETITPAVKAASNNKRVGVIATPGTIRSQAYQKQLKNLVCQSCPLFVPLVEEGWINEKTTIETAKKYLLPLKAKKLDTLILGCTHYPLLQPVISKIMGKKVKIISSAESISKEVKEFVLKNPQIDIKRGDGHQFFFSDQPYNFEKISHLCFNKKIQPIILDPFSE